MQVDEGKKDEQEGGNAAAHEAGIFPWALGWAYRTGAIGYEFDKAPGGVFAALIS